MNKSTELLPQITLFFEEAVVAMLGTAEEIRAKRYDLNQFGTIIGGEGENWEAVVMGDCVIDTSPPPPRSGVMSK